MATSYLSRTPASAGNRKTWTFSAWIKRSDTASEVGVLNTQPNSSNYTRIRFGSNKLRVLSVINGGTGSGFDKETSRVFRDNSAFYNIVIAYNSTLATSNDRVKIWVNGVLETDFSINSFGGGQNLDSFVNATNLHDIGAEESASYFNGLMSHVHLIDGLAYDASAFGEIDATTGIWMPKFAPSVTYGTNGFFLKFENSASLGLDSSVNTNNFTVNGTPTQTVDTPSNVFATMNPLSALTIPPTFSNGNLTTAIPTSGGAFRSTLAVSTGKWYCEVKLNEMVSSMIGIQPIDTTYSTNIFNDGAGIGLYSTSGTIYRNTSNLGNIASVASGDIIGMAIDLDSNNIYFSKNGQYASGIAGSWNQAFGSAYAVATTSGNEYCIAGSNGSSGTTSNFSYNFGNGFFGTTAVSTPTTDESGLGTFEYTVPAGYYALCTKNINTQEYS